MLTLPLLLLAACRPAGADLPERSTAGPSIALARHGAPVELELPARSRPASQAIPEDLPVHGPFEARRTVDGVPSWEAPLPVRPRTLFFSKAPAGMSVQTSEGRKLRFSNGTRGDKSALTWDFTADTVILRGPKGSARPEDGDYVMRYARATKREAGLNLDSSGLEPLAFAHRSLQLDEDTRTGLFLPAPAVAAWDVELPANAVLSGEATVLPPEADDGLRSDGATLVVELDSGGSTTELARYPLQRSTWRPLRLDLSAHGGKTGRLRLRTEGGANDLLDYVFVAEPTVYVPVKDPRRLLLVFVDTLRSDHLGSYGYHRDTTPKLDAWAQGAVVYENARSVAPWTLPSARTALSGHQPERWRQEPILPERLAAEGWVAGGFVGNIYLSHNFDMSAGWSHYNVVNWPVAQVQLDKVRAFLDAHSDRDAVVMLHLMDMHLPYTEPRSYRRIWAGDTPDGLEDNSTRSAVIKAGRKDRDAVRGWLIDRYDQNLRYVDDQLAALFSELGEQHPVVLFSDHGEEFWDHDDFEHGHTLYDELLRVPLVVRAPGLPAGRVEAPVSLLDLTPTVMELVGLPSSDFTGQSLVPLAHQDADAIATFAARPQAFGRPLYGDELWGVLADQKKWTSKAGSERLYDLVEDPAEKRDLSDERELGPMHAALGAALGTEAPVAWRLDSSTVSGSPKEPVVIELVDPRGFRHAWLGQDPQKKAKMTLEVLPDRVRITFEPGKGGAREAYVVPNGDVGDFSKLALRVEDDGQWVEEGARASMVGTVVPDGRQHILARARGGGRSFTVNFAVAPVPAAEDLELEGFDAEVEEALKSLGYLDD